MRLRLSGEKSSALRAAVAALVFIGVVLAVGLASAPQLHEWLHPCSEQTSHECAATLLATGGMTHCSCAPVLAKPTPAPPTSVFRPDLFRRVALALGFSRLEHAPPALA